MVKGLSILSFLLLASFSIGAQTSTQGTEFWLSFMMNGFRYNNGNDWVQNGVMMSAKRDCSGTISNPLTGWSESFSVESARVKFVSVPLEQGYNDIDETVVNKGLKVVTTDTVSIYYYSCATNSFDATFVLPVESIGNEYVIQSNDQKHTTPHEDTVLWQVDCPNWHLVSHGRGESCKLYIHTLLSQPVMLQATAINRCDTVHHVFPIQTTYFGLPEVEDGLGFEVSPNPSRGQIVLHFGALGGSAEIEVYNGMGQRIESFGVDLDSCNEMGYVMPNHDSGLYYFVLKNNGRTLTRKVAVVRN